LIFNRRLALLLVLVCFGLATTLFLVNESPTISQYSWQESRLMANSQPTNEADKASIDTQVADSIVTEVGKGNKPCRDLDTEISESVPAPVQTLPVLTREDEQFLLDGVPITPFGLRAVNTLQSDEITQRLIDNLDLIKAYGVQSISVNIQGGRATEGGNSNFNGYNADGSLKSDVFDRLDALLNATAERDMVLVIQMFYRGRDQELTNDTAVLAAVENSVNWLEAGGWNHYWLHVINEWYHQGFTRSQLRTPQGQVEIYDLIKSINSNIITHVSDATGANDGFEADTGTTASNGHVVIEYLRGDTYDEAGVFGQGGPYNYPPNSGDYKEAAVADATATFNTGGYWFWHAGWHQKADTPGWPRFDKGGAGTESDPGVSFIWNQMRSLTLPDALFLPSVLAE
jgi:hypothetical protein